MAKKNYKEKDYPEYRPFPLYALLICGIMLSCIGLYLIITGQFAHGVTYPGRSGIGGGKPISINGVSALVIGLLICIFPIYQLKKNGKKEN